MIHYNGNLAIEQVSNNLVYVNCYRKDSYFSVYVPAYFISPKTLVAMCDDMKCLFVSCPKKYGCRQFRAQ